MSSQKYFPLQLNQENMSIKGALQLSNRPLKSLQTDDILKAKTKQYYFDRNINGEQIVSEQIKHEPDRIGRYYDMNLNIRNPLFNDFRYSDKHKKGNSMQNLISQSQNNLPKDYFLYRDANRDKYIYQPKKQDLLSAYDQQSLQNRYKVSKQDFVGQKQVIFPQVPPFQNSEQINKDHFQNTGQQIINDQVQTQLKQYSVNLDPIRESNIFKNTQEIYKPYTNQQRQNQQTPKQSINQNLEFQSQQVRQDFENRSKNEAQYNQMNQNPESKRQIYSDSKFQNQYRIRSQRKETPGNIRNNNITLNYRPQFLDSSDIANNQTYEQEQTNAKSLQKRFSNYDQNNQDIIKYEGYGPNNSEYQKDIEQPISTQQIKEKQIYQDYNGIPYKSHNSRGNIQQPDYNQYQVDQQQELDQNTQKSRGNIIQQQFGNQVQSQNEQIQYEQLQKRILTENSHVPINSSKLFRPLNPITYKNHYEYEPKYNMPGVKWDQYQRENFSSWKDKQKSHQDITRNKNIQLHLKNDFVTSNKEYGNQK